MWREIVVAITFETATVILKDVAVMKSDIFLKLRHYVYIQLLELAYSLSAFLSLLVKWFNLLWLIAFGMKKVSSLYFS